MSFQKRVNKLKKFNAQIWKKRTAKRQESNDKKEKLEKWRKLLHQFRTMKCPEL
jgi:hypothetical protein